MKPQACPGISGSADSRTEASLNLHYQPLSERDKTCEELRAEALARQLVSGARRLVLSETKHLYFAAALLYIFYLHTVPNKCFPVLTKVS